MAVVVGDGNVEQPGGRHALQPGSESRERRIEEEEGGAVVDLVVVGRGS
jgi:hypothetical protein